MRTTLTIDDRIATELKRKVRNGEGKTFKGVVNETLQNGLLYEEKFAKKPVKPFKIKGRNLKARPGINFDKISELLAMIEAPDFK